MPSVLRSPRGRDAAVRPSGARRHVPRRSVGPWWSGGGEWGHRAPWHCPARGTLLPHIWRCTKTLPPDRSIAEQGADPPGRGVQPLVVSSGRSDRTFRHRTGTHR